MNRKALDLWVGFFVAIGIGALLFLALKVSSFSGIQMENTYQLQARFDNIGGLKLKSAVRSAGVLVGRVTDIRYDSEKYVALVEMHIDNRYLFPKDTFAAIYTSGLLGDQYIGLEPGGDEEDLADGATVLKTQSAVALEKLISQFMFNKASEGQTAPP
ncbi:MAG: outer membrane lipid asymmetry maintenance protein MlaD [Zoogloeaceae bacterium]|jgi:phospholipid/cholesterol/gamma-HCH transport system substrate-binding protein|nr:outer membrane lipid asymmetry maintenance protein MlaD [Zoogloeaceae bacterium]